MRQALVEQLPLLAKFFSDSGKEGYSNVLLPVLLEVLSLLTQDPNPQVRFVIVVSIFYWISCELLAENFFNS